MNRSLFSLAAFVLGAVCSAIIGEYTVRLLWSSEQFAIEEINKNAGVDEFQIVSPAVEKNPNAQEEVRFTDLTLLKCSRNQLSQNTIDLILAAALEEEFGSVKVGEVQLSARLQRVMRGYVTTVYDYNHAERAEVGRAFSLIQSLGSSVPFQAIANTGSPTKWRLTIFVC